MNKNTIYPHADRIDIFYCFWETICFAIFSFQWCVVYIGGHEINALEHVCDVFIIAFFVTACWWWYITRFVLIGNVYTALIYDNFANRKPPFTLFTIYWLCRATIICYLSFRGTSLIKINVRWGIPAAFFNKPLLKKYSYSEYTSWASLGNLFFYLRKFYMSVGTAGIRSAVCWRFYKRYYIIAMCWKNFRIQQGILLLLGSFRKRPAWCNINRRGSYIATWLIQIGLFYLSEQPAL